MTIQEYLVGRVIYDWDVDESTVYIVSYDSGKYECATSSGEQFIDIAHSDLSTVWTSKDGVAYNYTLFTYIKEHYPEELI